MHDDVAEKINAVGGHRVHREEREEVTMEVTMKKFPLAAVLLVATPAIADVNPVGCFLYTDTKSGRDPTEIRLSIANAPRDANWVYRFDVNVVSADRKTKLTAHGGCDPTRGPGAVRCYSSIDDGGRFLFFLRKWELSFQEFAMSVAKDGKELGTKKVTFGKADDPDSFVLKKLKDRDCNG